MPLSNSHEPIVVQLSKKSDVLSSIEKHTEAFTKKIDSIAQAVVRGEV